MKYVNLIFDRKLILFLLIFLCAFCIYSNALRSDFLLDDLELITRNKSIQSPLNLKSIWQTDYWEFKIKSGNYRPLLKQIWAFEVLFFGIQKKTFYILINIFIHSINAFLIFLLLRKLELKIIFSIIGILIYLVHPINSEIIVNVVGQGELLTSFCLIISWYLLTFVLEKSNYEKLFFILSIIILFCSLWIKEQSLLFPLLLFVYLIIKKYSIKKSLLFLSLMLIGILIYINIRINVLGAFGVNKAHLPIIFNSLSAKLSYIFYITGKYFLLFLYPKTLCAQYDWIIPLWKNNMWLNIYSILGLLVSVIIISFIIVNMVRKKYFISFLLFGIIFTMLPFIHIIPIGSPFAERHLAHSQIFVIAFIMFMSSKIIDNIIVNNSPYYVKYRNPIILTIILILISLSLRTYNRTMDWQDGLTLWSNEAKLSKDNYFAKHNYAVYLLRANKIQEAKKFTDEALTISPTFPDAHITRGEIAIREGDFSRAERHFKYAIEFDTPPTRGHYALANLLIMQGYIREGIAEFEKAKKFNPNLELPNY